MLSIRSEVPSFRAFPPVGRNARQNLVSPSGPIPVRAGRNPHEQTGGLECFVRSETRALTVI